MCFLEKGSSGLWRHGVHRAERHGWGDGTPRKKHSERGLHSAPPAWSATFPRWDLRGPLRGAQGLRLSRAPGPVSSRPQRPSWLSGPQWAQLTAWERLKL